MPSCGTCGKRIEAAARIYQSCGALTGVSMHTEPHASAFGFVAALTVGIIASLFLRWLGFLS